MLINNYLDHTTQTTSGIYAYVDNNFDATIEENAQFYSPSLRDSAAICQLNFWYSIKGIEKKKFSTVLYYISNLYNQQ